MTRLTVAVRLADPWGAGDLAYHLGKRIRFSEHQARFYAAEILLGIEHLHKANIVYRYVAVTVHGYACLPRSAVSCPWPSRSCRVLGVSQRFET